MSKKPKMTRLHLMAVTRKQRTKPHGVDYSIMLPEEKAVEWANLAGIALKNIAVQIQAEIAPVETQPVTQPEAVA